MDWKNRTVGHRKYNWSDPTIIALVLIPIITVVTSGVLSVWAAVQGNVLLAFVGTIMVGFGAFLSVALFSYFMNHFQSFILKLPIPDRVVNQKTFHDMVLAVRDHIDSLHRRGYYAIYFSEDDADSPLACSYGLGPEGVPEWCRHRRELQAQFDYRKRRTDRIVRRLKKEARAFEKAGR